MPENPRAQPTILGSSRLVAVGGVAEDIELDGVGPRIDEPVLGYLSFPVEVTQFHKILDLRAIADDFQDAVRCSFELHEACALARNKAQASRLHGRPKIKESVRLRGQIGKLI